MCVCMLAVVVYLSLYVCMYVCWLQLFIIVCMCVCMLAVGLGTCINCACNTLNPSQMHLWLRRRQVDFIYIQYTIILQINAYI